MSEPTGHDLRERLSRPEWVEAQNKLGLNWGTQYVRKPNESTCRISTDPTRETHEIWIPNFVIAEPEQHFDLVCHELCHASLAETVDPTFATSRFNRKYSNLDGAAHEKFVQQVNMFYLASAHVDIWVNDLRHKNWPELTEKDIRTTHSSLVNIVRKGGKDFLQQPQQVLAFAMNIAEARRHNIKRKPKNEAIFRAYERRYISFINEVAQYYQRLPQLPSDRRQALDLFEKTVQERATGFNVPIKPALISDGDLFVWNLD